jgi:hypothetical protein
MSAAVLRTDRPLRRPMAEVPKVARPDCQSAMLRCCGDDDVGKSRRAAPPSVPLRAVFSLGGLRTPAPSVGRASIMGPASETLHNR